MNFRHWFVQMSFTYYKERCEILEKENELLKEEVRKFKKEKAKSYAKNHNPNCDGDLWICDDCLGRNKK